MELRETFLLNEHHKRTMLFSRCTTIMYMLIALLLIVPVVTAQAQTTKKFSVTIQNEQLPSALNKISKASGYKINYNTEDLQKYKVSAQLKDVTVTEALDKVLEGKPFRYQVSKEFITIRRAQAQVSLVPAKGRTIKGFVYDESNEPLPGVSVRVKGDTKGNITSIDGEYMLSLSSNEKTTLIFSYIGMETQEVVIAAGTQDILKNITLKTDDKTLNEVVVTGIFNKPRESYTGAATSSTREQLESAGNRSLITTLRNLDPSFNIADNINIGSDPNSLPSITVRGASSLPTDVQDMQVSADNQRTANQPLFILDGFEISLTRFMDLDESQVESITLLKDANATAMYGSKGSNGVVVITSKAIEPGKLRFSYKGTLQIEAPDLSSYNLMNAAEKLEYERLAGLYETDRSALEDQNLKDLYNKRKLDVERGVNTYWLKYPVRTGIGSRHNVSIEGGDENLRYGASFSYNNVEGAMKGSNRNTLTGDMFLQYKYKNITFQNRLQITNSESKNSPYGSFSEYCKANAYFTPYDENDNLLKHLENSQYYASLNRRNTALNPLYNAYLPSKDTSEYTDITNNFSIEWYILPELFFRGQFSFSKQTNRSDQYVSAENTMFDNYTGDDYKRRGRYTYGTGNSINYNGQVTLNYTKTFNDKHQVFAGLGATAGVEASIVISSSLATFAETNFPLASILT